MDTENNGNSSEQAIGMIWPLSDINSNYLTGPQPGQPDPSAACLDWIIREYDNLTTRLGRINAKIAKLTEAFQRLSATRSGIRFLRDPEAYSLLVKVLQGIRQSVRKKVARR